MSEHVTYVLMVQGLKRKAGIATRSMLGVKP